MISLLPSTEDYQKFGRKTKLLIHPDNIPYTNISLPSSKQTKTISEESEVSENYQVSHEKSKVSSMEMLNSIDCPVEEMLNEVNVSLISAPCPVIEESTRDEHIEEQQIEELVCDKLKSFLSSRSAVKKNENSGFSFFL